MNQNPIGSVRSPEAEGESEIDEAEVDDGGEKSETADSKSREVTFLRGAAAFIVLFAVLWWMLSRSGE